MMSGSFITFRKLRAASWQILALTVLLHLNVRSSFAEELEFLPGQIMPLIQADDLSGKTQNFNQLGRSSKGLMIAFHSTSCPVSRQYGPTLANLQSSLQEQNIAFVIVNPIATDSSDSIKTLLSGFAPETVYIHDTSERVAKALGARSTTEVFFFDQALTLKYRGAVDDQFTVGSALAKPRHNWLMDAVGSVLGQKEVKFTITDPSGCLLGLEPGSQGPSEITYHNRISRIIQNNCLECHRQDGLAPFSLETYDDVKAHRGMMRREVARGQMPPWFAAPLSSPSHPGWSNNRSLSVKDKTDLMTWLESDLTEGNINDAPLPRPTADSNWQIGKPDLVLQLPAPIAIPAQGKVPYQFRTVATELKEDVWVQALEIRPTDRSVVHHALVFVSPPQSQADEENQGDGTAEERRGFFAGYVPGTSVMVFPDGYGKKLPKGSRLRFQIHYTPNGQNTSDQLELGIRFAKTTPEHEVKVIGVANPGIRIPAGVSDHQETAIQNVPTDVELLSFMPHMHVRGKAFRYEVRYPDGKQETLLDVPRYDFNWQLRYKLAKPIAVPAGSTILVTATFDNSEENPANPDPAKTVFWGPQTDEEMLLGYVEYEIKGKDVKSLEAGPPANLGPLARLIRGRNREETQKRLFLLLDTNKDDALDRKELDRLSNFLPRLKENPERLDNVFQTLDLNDNGQLSRDEMKNIRNLAGGG
ncbi:MAG: hypothetical protein RJA81_957 [Planctomycetota bacterium]